MTRATLAQASAWLLQLRATQNISESALEAKLAVRPIAASLIKTYAADVFRAESREAVSATLRFFKEPDIRERLDVWVKINAPETVPTLPPEALAAPIGATGQWLYGRFLTAADEPAAIRALDTLRSREHGAFDWVVRNDHGAAGYAVRRGWEPAPTPDELRVDWNDEPTIRRMAARIRAMACPTPWSTLIRAEAIKALLMAVGLHARHHLDAAVEELRGEGDAIPVAFVEEVTLFGEVI